MSAKPKKATQKPVAKRAATKKAASKKPVVKDERLHASTVENPVAVMWELCEKMKNKRRKDVMKAAQEAGIAFWTARTQYQAWSQASRASR